MSTETEQEIKLDATDYIFDLLVMGFLKIRRDVKSQSIKESAKKLHKLAALVDEDAGETAETVIDEQL